MQHSSQAFPQRWQPWRAVARASSYVDNAPPVREPGRVPHPRALANPTSCVRSLLSTWHCWSLNSISSHGAAVGAGHCAGVQPCTTCCQVYERAGGRGQLLQSSVQVPQLLGACCSWSMRPRRRGRKPTLVGEDERDDEWSPCVSE